MRPSTQINEVTTFLEIDRKTLLFRCTLDNINLVRLVSIMIETSLTRLILSSVHRNSRVFLSISKKVVTSLICVEGLMYPISIGLVLLS